MITKHTRTHECTQLSSDHGKRVHIIVPDEIEFNRSFKMCARTGPAPSVVHAARGCLLPSMQ